MGGGLCAGAMLHWKCNAPSHKHAARSASFHHGRSDDEEEEEGGMDLATLQAMMVEMVRKRKQATQRKQGQMVAELEKEVGDQLAAKEKELREAQKQLEGKARQHTGGPGRSAVSKQFAALEKQLDAKMSEIDAAALAFQQKLGTLWDQYSALYDRVEATAAETEAAASKQRTAAARGLEQLRDTLAAKAAEAERKIERANKKASKMPELAQMLAPFLG
ncbi:hypothetical protein COHA_002123 [Chlorella ohadii]|uniref:Uncharacterized protein n=1 Tax=Chlorella ohadii TaxID=2649997 RepID=A0AAD5H8B2_9CHLO|nr:hypothetical protein COHA_002123 [Chlorella ohadii]